MEIVDLAYSSASVTPGTLFVAVPSVDGGPGGARFIDDAARRGAVAVVARDDTPDHAVPIVRVPDPRAALADLADVWFGHPSQRLSLFGVTGTDGKTTTTYLLDAIFRRLGERSGLIGTVETRVGDERRKNPDRMTTPESLDLQRFLREMLDASVTRAAMEVSSHALALDRVRDCRFEAVALTNITGDHIEFHGSRESYIAAKRSLFDQVARGRPAVLNRDDESFARIAPAVSGQLLTYGFSPEADLQARGLRPDATGTSFEIVYQGNAVETRLPLGGDFNVLNALAAVGLALCAGHSLESIARVLPTVEGPPGRMQAIDAGQPFAILIDYAHTPHALRSVLADLRRRTPGRLIAVFGAAGNRDRAKRPLLAQIARANTDFFYITNEDPFGEDADSIITEIAAGVPTTERGSRYELEPDRGRAIASALEHAKPGDTVIITGKGHEQNIVVNGAKLPWSDASVVREHLEGPA